MKKVTEDFLKRYPFEILSEPKNSVKIEDQFDSVEIKVANSVPVYLFKLRKVSLYEVCILLKESSELLSCLKDGQTLKLEYFSTQTPSLKKPLKTKIKLITKEDQQPFEGHYLVGLSILEEQNFQIKSCN
jgi:hypothetical protein